MVQLSAGGDHHAWCDREAIPGADGVGSGRGGPRLLRPSGREGRLCDRSGPKASTSAVRRLDVSRGCGFQSLRSDFVSVDAFAFSHGDFASDGYSVGIVDDTVADGIGQSRFADFVMPAADLELGTEDG